jgi:signal transduction histidine kinase
VQIQQLLCNLIANAVDALSAGASVDRTLTLTSAVLESAIEVRVQDNGTGITEDVLKQMFDPFYTTKGNGMGMGLAICRSITKAHQGTLAARIAEGGGCVLTFTLPIAPATNR